MSKKNKMAAATNQNLAAATKNPLETFQAVAMNIDLSQIDPCPFNPRKEFAEEKLQELAASIRQHGVQTDIKVRPKDGGRYEIVYGERRFRASLLAGMQTIPAKVEVMTDEQAEICAIIENMQRENLTPFEEGETFCRLAQQRGMSVAELCQTFDKSEKYVRTRMNLTKLIPEVVQLLNNKDISLEVAKEFTNYDEIIQHEVYETHFQHDGYNNWKGIAAKEFAKRLYDRYMTKLDNYGFDKTECGTCQHNTLNQVLFQMCGDCAGCQNPTCLRAKNEAYLVDKCLDVLAKDPRLHLACNDQSNANVVARLTELGHEVLTLDMPLWRYDSEPQMPEVPQAEDFEDPDEFEFAKEDYEEELNRFKEKCVELEYAVSEGRKLKYAHIAATSVDFYYETVRNQVETADGQSWSVASASPAKKLQDKDIRNHQICYEHITKDLKKVLRCDADRFPKTALTPREEQFLYYVLLDRISSANMQILGYSGYTLSEKQRLEIVEQLTPERKAQIIRMAIMRYCSDLTEYGCKPESVDIKLLTEFSMQHFPDETQPIVERHQGIYNKRHANLEVRIKALEDETKALSIRSMFDAKALCRMPDGTVINVFSGEVIDNNALAMALEGAEIPQLEVEQPLPETSEPDITEEPLPDENPREDEPLDPYEFIPEEYVLQSNESLHGKGKQLRMTARKISKKKAA